MYYFWQFIVYMDDVVWEVNVRVLHTGLKLVVDLVEKSIKKRKRLVNVGQMNMKHRWLTVSEWELF